MEVVSDFNLYCDSQDLQTGKGDDFRVNLGSAGITAGDGQFIKLTLQSFNMYKNFYNVNPNNSLFTISGVITSGSVAFSGTANITRNNYKTIGDVATAFSSALATALASLISSTAVVSAVVPDPTLNMDDTSNRLIGFTITTGVALTSLAITCYKGNDSYLLLGVDEVISPATTSSFTITGATTSWAVSGKYPAQRSTEEHAYLRCDAVNNNLEMAGLSLGVMPTNISSILSSDILAKVVIDHEFVNFNTGTGAEFIMNLPNKTVNSLHFYLTDSKGRPLGRALGSESSTTTGTLQTTTGNFNCSFVVKVEIIQAFRPNKLISDPPPQNPLFAKKQGVLNNMNYGAGNY
jgi:hypothetical protein